MTPSTSTDLLALAQDLSGYLDPGATVLTVGADAVSLAEALVASGIQASSAGSPTGSVATSYAAAIIISASAESPHPASIRDDVLPRLLPGATILWATVHARAGSRLSGLLHLHDQHLDQQMPASLEATAITTHLESMGADVERLADVTGAVDPSLHGIIEAVATAGGDVERLRSDVSATHHLLRAKLPIQREPRDDSSVAALRSAVQGAMAAGVHVGRRRNSGEISSTFAGAKPRVSIIIPVFNGAALTEACLYAVAQNTGEGPDTPEYEVVVVDNGSDDWTMYLLHAMEGDLRVLNNDRNLGFARACNQGAGESQSEYLLFLNNDTVPHEHWLTAMVATADADPQVGIVGARLLYPNGTIQHAGLNLVEGLPDHEFRGVAGDDPRVMESRDLDMVTGACLLIRRDLFESIGGFDVQFVNGVEDVDLCLRARERGFRVVYCADATVEHHEAQSKGRFDHVQANVSKFVERWQGRFDTSGRLRPDSSASVAPQTHRSMPDVVLSSAAELSKAIEDLVNPPKQNLTRMPKINLEGSFFLHSSLAHVNRELGLALIESGRCDLGLLPFEADQFSAAEDPRFATLAERMGRPIADADVHIRHRWPPDLTPVANGRYALMQPWEFGSVPRAWVEAVGTGVVDQIWAYTRYVRDCYVDSGVDPSRVAIVPAGVDVERFRPDVTPHRAVKSERSFRFLFVGGTLYRKGIDLLLEAWRQAFGAKEDVSLIIKDMGVGTFYRNQTAGDTIRALQNDPGCAEILYLTDNFPGADMPGLYAAANALVHPYRGEGFGLPVAEAMACGLPVILTRGGACDDFCPDAIGYGVASQRRPVQLGGDQDVVGQAWQLEPDVDSLVQQMRSVFEGREDAIRRGAQGSEYIRTHVTWQHSAVAAMEAVQTLQSGDFDALPRATVQGATPANLPANFPVEPAAEPAPKLAVVLLDGASVDEAPPTLTEALGGFHQFSINTTLGYALGEQFEAIRNNCNEQGVELLFVLAPDIWDLTSAASAQELRLLREHFDATEDLGMLTPGTVGVQQGLDDVNYPEASCILCRLSALEAVGGFDASFQSAAVFANTARSLRRKNWRVAAADNVIVEEEDDSAEMVAFGNGGIAIIEMAAVESMESGDRRRDAGDVHGAIDFYWKTLEHKPDFVEAILVLADALVEAHDGEGAIRVVQRLIELDPESSFSHNYAGLVAARAGDVAAARAGFERALEIDPNLVDARVNLGVVEWEQQNLEPALLQFREASRLDPFNRDLVCNLGLVYGQIDDAASAVELYRGYLGRFPEDTELLARLARALVNTGDPAAAREAAQSVLQREPEHVDAQTILSEIDQDLGEDEAAQG
jgi:GT2 family glycosyltransferase/glycosyltransferase involved in cell wall biosynthesis/tetratricopeptide (TPR) repeat protein